MFFEVSLIGSFQGSGIKAAAVQWSAELAKAKYMTHQRSHERAPASAHASAHASVHESPHKSRLSLC